MNDWSVMLTKSLELETVENQLLEYIDAILSWVAKGDDLSYKFLKNEIGEQELLKRIEVLLDTLIVSDFAQGQMFPLSISRDIAKRRYRQLIRIFHPDRGVKSQVWLNHRAERVNKAYQEYVNSKSTEPNYVINNDEITSTAKKNNNQIRSNHRFSFRYRSSVWRERLGSPQQFQKRALLLLSAFSLLLVLMFYFSSEQQSKYLDLNGVVYSGDQLIEEIENSNNYVSNDNVEKILKEADLFILEGDFLNDDLSFYDEVNLVAEQKKDKDGSVSLSVSANSEENSGITILGEKVEIDESIVLQSQIIFDESGVTEKNNELMKQEKTDTSRRFNVMPVANLNANSKKIKTEQSAISNNQEYIAQEESSIIENEVNFSSYVSQLKHYYEQGDSKGTASLYISSGRENNIRGADKILKYYRKTFAKTDNRKFEFVLESAKKDAQSAVVIEGRLSISFSSKKIFKKVNTKIDATFKILLIKVGTEFKIASFLWSEL